MYCAFVPTEDIDCPCGAPHQTRAHILQACPLYEEHRSLLRDVVPAMDLNTILSTKDGIAALAKFIQVSSAFTKTGDTILS